jgi:nitric oxide dioxygenase
MTLSKSTLAVIDATAPVVAANLTQIVEVFYPQMFARNPEVLAFFNMSNQRAKRQPQALANAVLASVAHLHALDKLAPAFAPIAHKHCALGILPEHYAIVHDNFLGAVGEVLGDAVTDEVAAAWSAVLMELAGALIGIEESMYAAAAARPGGWRGTKEFVVTKARDEHGGTARSLWFAPKDGSAVPEFTPGQYLTVSNDPRGEGAEGLFAPRHYTISSDTELRITVKKVQSDGFPAGQMSSWLTTRNEGDTVLLRPPFGAENIDSLFPAATTKNVVFASGGVGVTPVRTLAAALAARGGVKLGTIHAGHEDAEHPLCDEIDGIVESSMTGSRDVLTSASIKQFLAKQEFDPAATSFYICGPAEMMTYTAHQLVEADVPKGSIKWSAFGPAIGNLFN